MGLHGHERAPKKLLAIRGDQCREHNATGQKARRGEKDPTGARGLRLMNKSMYAQGMHGHESSDASQFDLEDPLSKHLRVFVSQPDTGKKADECTG